jgi:hypothetical protein
VLTIDRLTAAIEAVRVKLAAIGPVKAADLDTAMALTFEDHFSFQELQARAHVEQQLSTDAAQLIYVALGEVGSDANGGWSASADTATKVVVTQLMGELLQRRLAAR